MNSVILVLFVTTALLAIAVITLVNRFFALRLMGVDMLIDQPFVSVLIPARNEDKVIGETISALLFSDYTNYEIILLDDQSEDNTIETAQSAAKGSARLQIISGQPLPSGWAGKNWACHQMAQVARGEILLFTDADVRWSSGALSALVAQMYATRADLYTVWPTQVTLTWTERLVVPLMAMVILGYLPIAGTHYAPLAAFGAANGQCMAWRRSAYQRVGGHVVVANNVLEDVTLARKAKAHGLRLRMADGHGLVQCRMYDGWSAVRNGYAKNILAGYGGLIPLVAATVFHWLIFLFPWVWLVLGRTWTGLSGWPLWPALLISIGLLVRAYTAAYTRQRVLDAVFLPVSVFLMTIIAFQAIYWHIVYGGPRWKGRSLSRRLNV